VKTLERNLSSATLFTLLVGLYYAVVYKNRTLHNRRELYQMLTVFHNFYGE